MGEQYAGGTILPAINPGPDLLTVTEHILADPADHQELVAERHELDYSVLAGKLPTLHLRKSADIPLPMELWAWDWDTGGPLIWGSKGSGKTQAATSLAIKSVSDRSTSAQRVCFVSTSRLFVDLRRAMDHKETDTSLLARLRTAEFVILDDFGRERASDYVEEQMFVLFDDLYNREVRIVITTNVTPESLDHKVGEYTADRVAEMTVPYFLNAPSHRRNP